MANAVKSLKGQYHQDWNFNVVKNGDKLDIGNGKELMFIEMAMLHWPDSLAAFMTGDNILFSNDAFGQHYATGKLFNDQVDQCELMQEAMKYYANILAPFSMLVKRKIAELTALNLPIEMIVTSHGTGWRENPQQIIDKYDEWANNYQENQITIVYDTMYNGTKELAEAIAEGIELEDQDVLVKVIHLAKHDLSDVIVEVFKSKAVAVGSPTILNDVMNSVAAFAHYTKLMKLKNKKAAAFGCYGWSGEAVKLLNQRMKDAGFDVIGEGCRISWAPDEDAKKSAVEFGRTIAKA